MSALHTWYVLLPWSVALAILLGVTGTCSLIAAWIFDRQSPNKRERRLARKRRVGAPSHTVGRTYFSEYVGRGK